MREIKETRPDFVCKRGPVVFTSHPKNVPYEHSSKVDFEKIIGGLKK